MAESTRKENIKYGLRIWDRMEFSDTEQKIYLYRDSLTVCLTNDGNVCFVSMDTTYSLNSFRNLMEEAELVAKKVFSDPDWGERRKVTRVIPETSYKLDVPEPIQPPMNKELKEQLDNHGKECMLIKARFLKGEISQEEKQELWKEVNSKYFGEENA